RERRDDIPLLAHQFLQRFAQQFNQKARRFSQEALQTLEEHTWPGNVRELENVVQRAVVLSEGQTVDIAQLPAALRHVRVVATAPQAAADVAPLSRSYEDEVRRFKRSLVVRA